MCGISGYIDTADGGASGSLRTRPYVWRMPLSIVARMTPEPG